MGVVTLGRWLILSNNQYPTGIDGGNWLAFGHAMLGEHIRAATLRYPPVVPLLAVACEHLFGPYLGLKVLALGAGLAPAAGAYALLRSWSLRWRATVLASVLAASAGTSEALAWGGYPQLIGLGLLPIYVLALDRFLVSKQLRTGLLPAVLMGVALATNEFTGPLTALVATLYGSIRLLKLPPMTNSRRNLAGGVAIHIAAGLPVAPIYFGLASGVIGTEKVKLAANGSLFVLGALGSVGRELPAFWAIGLVAALLAAILVFGRGDRLAILSTSLLFPALVLLLWSGEVRLAYTVPMAVVIGIASWLRLLDDVPKWIARTVDAALVTFLVVDLFAGAQYFAMERNYYTVLSPGIVQGLDELDNMSTTEQVVAVSPTVNDWVLGWWVEGAARRPTIYAGNPVWLNYSDELKRNSEANQVFSDDSTVEQSLELARQYGVSYLFVDKNWAGYTQWRTAQAGPAPGIVYENEAVLILSTGLP